ncbi:DUF2062 domain-containing protein [Lysinibacillus sp. KU-BSD001]|uniref:DUF2062 domain-containing protein n=1 Tax=Lysinibacillus sp. KU-BSD001 TaxID=3141328 RepID=UPI0036E53910
MKIARRMKYYLLRLFRLNASPHQVAVGFTMGLIPHWFPTFGLGPVLSIGLAKLARANTVSAIVGGVMGTPAWPLLFLLNYQVGSLLLDRKTTVDEVEDVDYINALYHTVDGIDSMHSSGYLFLTGAIINILISSIFIYFIVYFLFKMYRMRILHKIR